MILLALPTLGCGVPLPAPQLTATAESVLSSEGRTGRGADETSSSGAPGGGALILETPAVVDAVDGDEPSALAPSEAEEATAVARTGTPEAIEAEETPAPSATLTPAAAVPTATPEVAVSTASFPAEMLTLLNQVRSERGLSPLQFNASLSQAAMSHAGYMAANNFFGHYPPNGSTPSGRIAAVGFAGTYKGEALSAGQKTPGVALGRLLGSAAHANILLSSSSVAVGIGHAYNGGSYYKHYWVVVTGNP